MVWCSCFGLTAPLRAQITPWVLGQNLSRSAANVNSCHGPAKALPLPAPITQPSYRSCRVLQPQDQARLDGTCSWGRRTSMPVAQRAISAWWMCPHGDTQHFLQGWGLPQCGHHRPRPSCGTWLSGLAATLVPTLVDGLWSRTTLAAEAPSVVAVPRTSPQLPGRRLERPSPPWQCCQPQGEQPGVGTRMHKARGLWVPPCKHGEKASVGFLQHLGICCLHVIPVTAVFRGLAAKVLCKC